MAGMLRVSRSRGAFSGVLLVLLGLWGGLIPLVGPYVNYAYSPDRAWTLTHGRIWLEILPAVGTLVGGLILLAARLRPFALFGASLAVLSGAWFAIGRVVEPLWSASPSAGTPVGGQLARTLEQVGLFTGLGLVIICVASAAIGRLSVVSVRDARVVKPAPAAPAPDTTATSRIPVRRTPMTRVGRSRTAGADANSPAAAPDSPVADSPEGTKTGVFLRKVKVGSGSSS
ncbi:MAG TPA: hypothetical protein VLX31_15110 [Streptosporangiaceae bacterium]|nr:hypothetical protein [Streptosporangiaceae bacterium]